MLVITYAFFLTLGVQLFDVFITKLHAPVLLALKFLRISLLHVTLITADLYKFSVMGGSTTKQVP